eukprot:TRINITY_DN3307_c0_g1_i1.p1 TRINITY_DN3307_c0_g1~~TRINITY_DN3307_c0_g1_i1.p1  ORF type:complete len:277 (+),score=37.56 TRINITY_DN3307_c0_g1_i1:324-1154(+)
MTTKASFECEESIDNDPLMDYFYPYSTSVAFLLEHEGVVRVASSAHLIKPWVLDHVQNMYSNFSRSNCYVSEVYIRNKDIKYSKRIELDITEEAISDSTPGHLDNNDIVLFTPPENDIIDLFPAFKVDFDWTNGTTCQLLTFSKPKSDFDDIRDQIFPRVEDEEVELVQNQYERHFVGNNTTFIVGEGNCYRMENGLGSHTIPSVRGFSGSPIVVQINGLFKVIGVHVGNVGERSIMGRFDHQPVRNVLEGSNSDNLDNELCLLVDGQCLAINSKY